MGVLPQDPIYNNLGEIYQTRSDLAQAEAMYQKSLALFQAVGAVSLIKYVQERLASLREH